MDKCSAAGIATCSIKGAERVIGYMWYIHVLVKVNTEERLRAKIARFLNLATSPSSTSLASSTTPLCPFGLIPCSTTGQPQLRQPRRPNTDTLTDHLIL